MELEARGWPSGWLEAVREGEYKEASLIALESDFEAVHEKALMAAKGGKS